MRVAVLMDEHPAGRRFAEALRGRGIDVVEVTERIDEGSSAIPQATVFLCGATRTVRAVVKSLQVTTPHIIATLRTVDEKKVSAALKAGAVDVISVNACAEELVARVLVPTRCSAARPLPQGGEIVSCDEWNDAVVPFSDTLTMLVGSDVSMDPYDGRVPGMLAGVRTTCRSDGSTADVLVGGTFSDAGALLTDRGLDSSVETLRDFLLEGANLLAGRFKEHLSHGGVLTTLGLPEEREADLIQDAVQSWTVRCGSTVLVLGLVAGKGGRKVVPVRDLTPGMVLRHDVLNAAGAPFIRAGFALTERTVARLHEVLGDSFLVSVAGQPERKAPSDDDQGILLF